MTTRAQAVLYCDTSALARAYLADEPEHLKLSDRLLGGQELVISSALTEVELVAAIGAAARAGRIADARASLGLLAIDLHRDRTIVLVALDGPLVVPRARDLCERHRLRALGAVHLAVALTGGRALAGDADLVFVTRDAAQATAARAEGLAVE